MQISYDKFNEQIFKFIVCTFITFVGIYVVLSKEYFWDTRVIFITGWPQRITKDVILYYNIGIGYHGHRFIFQYWESHVGPDFFVCLRKTSSSYFLSKITILSDF